MAISITIFFVLTILFFISNKEDTGPIKVLKSLWYTTVTIGSVAVILGSICLGFMKYQEVENNRRAVAYQKSLEKETLEYNQCIEQAKRIASYNNYTLDTAVYIAGCVKPSGY